MKTIKYLTLRLMAVAAIAIAFALPAKAQVTPFTYFNVDWQFNAPISNNFANKASGWGMNFEGGYFTSDTTNQQLGSPDNRPATFRISVAFRFRNTLSLQ